MRTMRAGELAALWTAIDEETGGALYALRYECENNGWTPHIWAQTPEEGGPSGFTRLMFFGGNSIGKTMYWDSVLVRDTTGLAPKIKMSETIQDARRATERIHEGLDRMDRGLDPTPDVSEVRTLN